MPDKLLNYKSGRQMSYVVDIEEFELKEFMENKGM